MNKNNLLNVQYPAVLASKVASLTAVIVGGMVLLGCAFDIGVLKSVLPGWVSMKANAAICFILIGIALWLTTRHSISDFGFRISEKSLRTPLARLCGLLVGLIGLLTLGEYVFGWNCGIDQWLFREPVGTVDTSAPGRMAPETALCFVLLSVALWINSTSRKTGRSILASVNLGLLVMTIALAAMLSYAMPGLGPYGWFGLTIMALHTSLLFALLGVAVIANSWQQDVLQWSLGRKFAVAFAGGMALLVFIGLNASRSQFWLNETNHKIVYSEEVLGNIVGMQTELVEAEAHTRGYIITGDDWFMTAYLADMSGYNIKMDALRPLIAGHPHQQQQLALIETKADLLRRWSQQFIDAQRSGKGNAARSKMGAHAGDLLDNLRSTFDQIENEQQQLINGLKQEAESVTRFAYISIASGTFSSLLIFLIVIFRLNFAVNERKQAEEKIRQQQELTTQIIETLPMRIFWKDRDSRLLGCNTLLAQDAGLTRPDELIGKTDFDMVWKDQAELYRADDRRVMDSNTPKLSYDEPQTTQEGAKIWLRTSKVPLRDAAHNVIGILGIYDDITERKAIEMRLRESEEKFKAIFDNATDGIMLADMDDKKLLFGNATICRMLGYAAEEISKLHVMDIHPKNELPYVISEFERQARGEKVVAENMPVMRKDGSVFYAEITTAHINLGGKTYLAGFFRDITERKQAEEALRKTHVELSLFRNLLDNSSDLIAVVDPITLRYLDANEAACRNLGYSREEFLSMSVFDIDPSINPDAQKAIDEQMQKSGAARFEGIQRRKDGSIFPVEISSKLVKLDKPYVLNVVRDISERKQAEEEIYKLNEKLEAKVQERTQQLLEAQDELVRKEKLAVLGQVAGSVGHELRNPLGVMSNAVYFLQTVLTNADDSVKEYLNIIKSEIAGSERIVSDLLDSVRTKPPQPEAVGVAELIGQTLNKLVIPSPVTVKLDIPAELPPLLVDAQQIQQVLRNLISNGIEAMPEGGTLEIRAIENRQSGTVAVSVRDTGIGMTAEQMGKLFQPLFTTKARGIGLGLVVVKNLTKNNGGTVKVESEAGKGTLFSVTLPAADEKGVSI